MAGSEANILEGVSLTPSDEDSLFKASDFLADGEPGTVFRFGTVGANSNVIANLGSRLRNGDFEGVFVSGVPQSWVDLSTGDGALAEESTVVNAGGSTKSLKLSTGASGTGEAKAGYSMRVEAGWGMSIQGALYENSSATVRIRVLNLDTGKYLNSSGVWVTGAADWFTRTAASWSTSGPTTFTVEAASVAERAVYTLLITISIDGTNSVAYVDDLFIWPHWNFAAMLGAEYPPTVTARLRSDTVAAMSSPANRVAFPFERPAAWGEPAGTVTDQFLQLYFDGTPLDPITVGEVLVGRMRTLPDVLLQPVRLTSNVAFSTSGDERNQPVSLERDASRNFRLTTFAKGEAELNQITREFSDALRWGGGRLFIVPDSTKQRAYYGWVGHIEEEDIGKDLWRIETDFRGYPFAVHVL